MIHATSVDLSCIPYTAGADIRCLLASRRAICTERTFYMRYDDYNRIAHCFTQ
jgi:hypothetical protein